MTIPLTVTVRDSNGAALPGLPVYAFSGGAYLGYRATTDASGQAVFVLPQGSYRFRVDHDGGLQSWSAGSTDACALPGCTAAAVTVPVGMEDMNVTIDYTYDPLNRLRAADYSDGMLFHYTYDSMGNRLSRETEAGITTYSYNDVNQLVQRVNENGTQYAYDWSNNGELLAETSSGNKIRSFTYNPAGEMISAIVSGRTTEFLYNGLGNRYLIDVEETGATRNTLDLTNNGQILVETTPTSRIDYLYGNECLGQYENGHWLYYLGDGSSYVRQAVDEFGMVIDTWQFDSGGYILSGPQGSVNHLLCGSVYDWSTGLVFDGRRYFDPNLGIWLVTGGMVLTSGKSSKKQKNANPHVLLLVVFLVIMAGVLSACGGLPSPEVTDDLCTPEPLDLVNRLTNTDWEGTGLVNFTGDVIWHDLSKQGILLSLDLIQRASGKSPQSVVDWILGSTGGSTLQVIGFPGESAGGNYNAGALTLDAADTPSYIQPSGIALAIHEMAHGIDESIGIERGYDTSFSWHGENGIGWNPDWEQCGPRCFGFVGDDIGLPTSYARNDPGEDFASSFASVVIETNIQMGLMNSVGNDLSVYVQLKSPDNGLPMWQDHGYVDATRRDVILALLREP